MTNADARALPARANLEHLRNEAKARLKDMRGEDRGAKLAEAQLVVARSYGFASWRRLKACVDALDNVGEALIQAVRAGDLETLRALLDGNPDVVNATTDLERLLRPSDTRAMRLIHLAVAENRPEVLRLLIERGANLNVRNADGRLPVHDCFELDHDELARMLFGAGAEADVCAAAVYGMHDRLREILQADAAQADDLRTGLTPLGWSAFGDQPESARILIAHGATFVKAWGPLSLVAGVRVARVLLEAGADPNCRNDDGDTPLHAVIKSRLVKDPSAFVELLLAAGADRSIRNYAGRTALEEASLQSGRAAETYFPARPIGQKNLVRTIELLS